MTAPDQMLKTVQKQLASPGASTNDDSSSSMASLPAASGGQRCMSGRWLACRRWTTSFSAQMRGMSIVVASLISMAVSLDVGARWAIGCASAHRLCGFGALKRTLWSRSKRKRADLAARPELPDYPARFTQQRPLFWDDSWFSQRYELTYHDVRADNKAWRGERGHGARR